ncbi:MAG: hypothetical protein KDA52_06555 [Planctomycetaceae bacterium]|nr:hypothetical protein [Planctomycetaceae bacterium]
MFFDPEPFNMGLAAIQWLLTLCICCGIALAVVVVLSLSVSGVSGPANVWRAVIRGVRDIVDMSPKRIGAVASLTLKESLRRQDVLVGVVFVLLFMFAGWFLSSANVDTPAKPYISFVLTAIRWLILPVALLLSCWGLPADIKARSLHTVVTKPARRSEVVLGRMLGYSSLMTVGVAIMGLVGYVWITRQVPESAQHQLISRVPQYGQLTYLDRTGAPSFSGINVGDMWDYRSFVEGNTKAAAIFTFTDLNTNRLSQDDQLQLEYRFEVFRTHKGDIEKAVQAQFTLVNEQSGLRVPYPRVPFEVKEFADMQARSAEDDGRLPIITIPRELTYTPEGELSSKTVDLFEDVIHDGTLTVQVRCVDQGQYLGAARTDLFVRLPDKTFAVGYFKAIWGTWMMAILVIVLGTTASTFVKGPVATLLTFAMVLTGLTLRPFMSGVLEQYQQTGVVQGGGMLESAYRMVTQMNTQVELPGGFLTEAIQWIDDRMLQGLLLLQNVIPDFTHFDMTPYVANGFDVPWNNAMMPSIATTLAFILPALILGYFCLQWRELEAK